VSYLTKRRARRRGKGKLRTVLIPVAAFILVVLLGAGTYSAATSAGWSISSIGIPAWITGLTGQGQGGTVQTATSVSWNGQAWVTSTYTLTNNPQQTLIPPGVIATKMSLVASYTDNTNQTIFENSTLPGFGVIPMIHGKQVRSVTALAAVAVLQPQGYNLPEGSIADFKLNFTAYITHLNVAKWNFVEKLVPFLNGGTIAIAPVPPFTVLPGEVFADNPTGTGSRQVAWNLHAEVVITAPNRMPLTLIPTNDLSSATWDYSGQITSGCTDCAGSGNTMSGVSINSKGDVSVSNPTTTSSSSQSVTHSSVAEHIVSEQSGVTYSKQTATTPAGSTSSVSLGCTATECTSITTTHDPGGAQHQTATTKPVQTVTTVGSHTYTSTSSGGIAGTAIRPGQNGVLLTELPYPVFGIQWGRLQLGRTVYLLNPAAILLTLIVAFGIAGIITVYLHLRKEER
jgi:hypothetical protein